MDTGSYKILEKKIIIQLHDRTCETVDELMESALFKEVLRRGIRQLEKRNSFLMEVFGKPAIQEEDLTVFVKTLSFLTKMSAKLVPNVVPGAQGLLKDPALFHELTEYLYNYWRSFDRFLISDSTGKDLDQRPYRTFNSTIGQLTNLILGTYRDIQENISGQHPRIYRQVAAGAEIATIALQKEIPFRDPLYKKLNKVAQIRQILLVPPLILNPPMNKRTGKFEKIGSNPLEYIDVSSEDWLCYPAKVGSLVILVYFHNKFSELGHSLCNLFELADDIDLQRSPDAVFLFGVPGDVLDQYGVFPTVFYEDIKNNQFVAAVPGRDEFGYFGYVKKMVLTLHNIIMMKQGRFPFHGALVRLILKGGKDVTLLFIGDTGAGKSETLEALREVGEEAIQDMIIIADDMGSIRMDNGGEPIGYGTETGAFLRLDDLKPGYALGQIDRAIIMSPNMVNARIILPVTTYDCVVRGEKVDYVFYANNYEEIDDDHPLVERVPAVDKALAIFKEGTVMSKGTTSSSGIVHSYFANIFGPPQYRQLHEAIAEKTFQAFFDKGIFVGQIRTRLGLRGWEKKGPVLAAQALLDLLVAGGQDKE